MTKSMTLFPSSSTLLILIATNTHDSPSSIGYAQRAPILLGAFGFTMGLAGRDRAKDEESKSLAMLFCGCRLWESIDVVFRLSHVLGIVDIPFSQCGSWRGKVVIDLERLHLMLGSFFDETDTIVGADARLSFSSCLRVSAFLLAISRLSSLRRFSLLSSLLALSSRE